MVESRFKRKGLLAHCWPKIRWVLGHGAQTTRSTARQERHVPLSGVCKGFYTSSRGKKGVSHLKEFTLAIGKRVGEGEGVCAQQLWDRCKAKSNVPFVDYLWAVEAPGVSGVQRIICRNSHLEINPKLQQTQKECEQSFVNWLAAINSLTVVSLTLQPCNVIQRILEFSPCHLQLDYGDDNFIAKL